MRVGLERVERKLAAILARLCRKPNWARTRRLIAGNCAVLVVLLAAEHLSRSSFDAKIRRLVDANIIGIFIFDLDVRRCEVLASR